MDKRPSVVKLFDFSGHNQAIYNLQNTGDGYTFYSAGGDGMVVSWDIRTPDNGKLIATLGGAIYSMCHIPEFQLLAVGKNNDGIHFLKTDSNLAYGSIHTGNNILFDMVNDKDRLLVGTGAGALLEVDIQSLSVIRRAQISEKSIRCLAINKTTGQVAVGSSDNHIRIFEYPEMNCSKAWLAHLNSVFGVAFSPDGKSLISVSRDAHLKKWDVVEDYENIRSIPAHLFAINKVAISPDGEYFVTCSMDKTIKLWSGETCELLRVLDKNRHGGHSNSVNCAIWLNSDIFITAGDDCKISIWKLNKSYI